MTALTRVMPLLSLVAFHTLLEEVTLDGKPGNRWRGVHGLPCGSLLSGAGTPGDGRRRPVWGLRGERPPGSPVRPGRRLEPRRRGPALRGGALRLRVPPGRLRSRR